MRSHQFLTLFPSQSPHQRRTQCIRHLPKLINFHCHQGRQQVLPPTWSTNLQNIPPCRRHHDLVLCQNIIQTTINSLLSEEQRHHGHRRTWNHWQILLCNANQAPHEPPQNFKWIVQQRSISLVQNQRKSHLCLPINPHHPHLQRRAKKECHPHHSH